MVERAWMKKVQAEVARLYTEGTSRYTTEALVNANGNPGDDPHMAQFIRGIVDKVYAE